MVRKLRRHNLGECFSPMLKGMAGIECDLNPCFVDDGDHIVSKTYMSQGSIINRMAKLPAEIITSYTKLTKA